MPFSFLQSKDMNLNVTREEMRIRFRLYGELYLLCAELQGDEDGTLDNYSVSFADINGTMRQEDSDPILLKSGTETYGEVLGVWFLCDMAYLNYRDMRGDRQHTSILYVHSAVLRQIVERVSDYLNFLKREERI